MRVLQLIDSLEAGGAERMAVNLANALQDAGFAVVLVASRKGGVLKSQIHQAVPYYCLHKKSTLDYKAIQRLKQIIKTHQVTILHAHSSSFFMAYLVKLVHPNLRLIWHDHYGNSEHLEQRSFKILQYCSKKFDAIVAVNQKLADWSKSVLKHPQVVILTNFVILSINQHAKTKLNGTAGKRIVCLANLRPQKDHITLITAFKLLVAIYPDWTLHLIGKDFKDDYSKTIDTLITECQLEEQVFCYGSCEDISYILDQASIGVLSSQSEGLPLALLEYGLNNLPVVATNVGDTTKVINHQKEGLIVPANDIGALLEALRKVISSPEKAKTLARNLNHKVRTDFSVDSAVHQLNSLYKHLQNV